MNVFLRVLGACLALLLAAECFAQGALIELDADTTSVDRQSNRISFTGITIRQAGLSIRADRAESSSLDFAEATWNFAGRIAIRTPQGDVSADSAELVFTNQQLQTAVLQGGPLEFTQAGSNPVALRSTSARLTFSDNELARARFDGTPVEFEQGAGESLTQSSARRIEFDAAAGVLRLEEAALIRQAGSEITGNVIEYNIAQQRVMAAADDDGRQRVRITITPPANGTRPVTQPDADTPQRQP